MTGELLPEAPAALWLTADEDGPPPASSSHEEVDDPDSSSVESVGGWSPTWLARLYSSTILSRFSFFRLA